MGRHSDATPAHLLLEDTVLGADIRLPPVHDPRERGGENRQRVRHGPRRGILPGRERPRSRALRNDSIGDRTRSIPLPGRLRCSPLRNRHRRNLWVRNLPRDPGDGGHSSPDLPEGN